jgi:GNAT superfamily N-acetyltransferase
MDEPLVIRGARAEERAALTELQRRAALMWEEDRAALLAEPEAIDIPQSQIDEGHVFVAEREGRVLGFGVVLQRSDHEAELDGLYVEPDVWGEAIGRQPRGGAGAVGRRAHAQSGRQQPGGGLL